LKIQKGIPSQRLIVGVGHNSVADTVEMIRESLRLNCLAVLWHPPFYYKNLADHGVIEYYKQCLDRIEDRSALKVILYNFPANTCVPVTHNIIEQLMTAYPGNIMGMKDSSFSYDHTYQIIQRFPKLKMYVGKDTDTSELVRNGACGAIVAFSNMAPDLMQSLYEYGKDNTKPNRNDEILKLWDIVNGNSTANSRAIGLPALKGIFSISSI
jgi:4-hydroxy-tetrahydrodipicolinate synthase